MDYYYPEIDGTTVLPVRLALNQMIDDPLWLDRPQCPYDEETTEVLRALWLEVRGVREKAAQPRAERKPLGEGASKWAELASEAEGLFQELRDFRDGIPIEDTKDRLAYYRTATVLLDKMVALGERSLNLRNVSEFQEKVVSVFDQIMTPEQRTRATEMLAA